MSMWRPLFIKCIILEHKLQRMLNDSKIAQLNSERPLLQTAVHPLLSKYRRKYVIKKTNQITLLSTEGDPIHSVITSQTKFSEHLNLVLSWMISPSIETCSIWFVFFYNGLWGEAMVSIRCLTLMCRSFLTTKESVNPPPTCHWGTRSFASQRSLGFSSPPGHKLFRPGKNQVEQFEAGTWPYGRQLNVTFWIHLHKERFTI